MSIRLTVQRYLLSPPLSPTEFPTRLHDDSPVIRQITQQHLTIIIINQYWRVVPSEGQNKEKKRTNVIFKEILTTNHKSFVK